MDVSIKLSGDEGIGLALDLFGAGTSKSDSSELEHLDFLLLCSSLDCVSCLNCFEPGVCSMASQSDSSPDISEALSSGTSSCNMFSDSDGKTEAQKNEETKT